MSVIKYIVPPPRCDTPQRLQNKYKALKRFALNSSAHLYYNIIKLTIIIKRKPYENN